MKSRTIFHPILWGLLAVLLPAAMAFSSPTMMYTGVASATGANNTVWRSEVTLYNATTVTQSILTEIIPQGSAVAIATHSFTLNAGTTQFIPDIYDDTEAPGGAGTLRITGEVFSWVRTYNQSGQGTFGQGIPAAQDITFFPGTTALFPVSVPETVDSGFRSNLILQSLGAGLQHITLNIMGTAHTVDLPAGVFLEISNVGSVVGAGTGRWPLAVSSDGSWAGFISTVDPVTGDPTTVRGILQPAASERIVFPYAPTATEWRDIWSMNPNGSDVRPLISMPDTDELGPRVSPDGRWVAFISDAGDIPQVWVARSDGGGARQLTHADAPGVDFGSLLAWFPSSFRIAYTVKLSATESAIHAVDLDGLNDAVLMAHAGAQDYDPALDPRYGRYLVYSHLTGSSEAAAETRVYDLMMLTETVLISSSYGKTRTDFSWSPDGNQIALTVWDMNSNGMGNVYVINWDGTGLTRLTQGTSSGEIRGFPRWSPSGTKLTYWDWFPVDSTTFDIYTMKANGNNPNRIFTTTNYSLGGLDWAFLR